MKRKKEVIRASHHNGFSGVLYGESSMIIYYKEHEVLHTGFRNPNTIEELIEVLKSMPDLMKALDKVIDDSEEL